MESVPDTIQMEFTEEIKEYVSGFLGSSATCLGECQGFPPRDGGSGWDISKEKCLEIDNIYYESIEFYISLIKNRRNIFLVETKRISLKTSFTFNKFRITYDANLKYPKRENSLSWDQILPPNMCGMNFGNSIKGLSPIDFSDMHMETSRSIIY